MAASRHAAEGVPPSAQHGAKGEAAWDCSSSDDDESSADTDPNWSPAARCTVHGARRPDPVQRRDAPRGI
jgi:hypothetical protein